MKQPYRPTEPIISNAELNLRYGDKGRTFPTRSLAEDFAKGKRHARIYPLWDELNGVRRSIGFLVSIEQPPEDRKRFTGKVRAE